MDTPNQTHTPKSTLWHKHTVNSTSEANAAAEVKFAFYALTMPRSCETVGASTRCFACRRWIEKLLPTSARKDLKQFLPLPLILGKMCLQLSQTLFCWAVKSPKLLSVMSVSILLRCIADVSMLRIVKKLKNHVGWVYGGDSSKFVSGINKDKLVFLYSAPPINWLAPFPSSL